MNERVSELLTYVRKWLTEALAEWGGSIKDSPEAHLYTAIAIYTLATVMRWIL